MLGISEKGNTITHLIGTLFALGSMWMAWPAVHQSWQMAFGVIFFICGMFIMFLSSTIYHWVKPGRLKNALQRLDHISIYVMIACSYSPICVGLIGGWLGWLVFGLQWGMVVLGIFYKLLAFGRWPRLSLTIYLVMGWCIVLITPAVWSRMSATALSFLLTEGILYSIGTYFFAHDYHRHYHAIWHIFVLLGAMAHWSVVLCLLI